MHELLSRQVIIFDFTVKQQATFTYFHSQRRRQYEQYFKTKLNAIDDFIQILRNYSSVSSSDKCIFSQSVKKVNMKYDTSILTSY